MHGPQLHKRQKTCVTCRWNVYFHLYRLLNKWKPISSCFILPENGDNNTLWWEHSHGKWNINHSNTTPERGNGGTKVNEQHEITARLFAQLSDEQSTIFYNLTPTPDQWVTSARNKTGKILFLRICLANKFICQVGLHVVIPWCAHQEVWWSVASKKPRVVVDGSLKTPQLYQRILSGSVGPHFKHQDAFVSVLQTSWWKQEVIVQKRNFRPSEAADLHVRASPPSPLSGKQTAVKCEQKKNPTAQTYILNLRSIYL